MKALGWLKNPMIEDMAKNLLSTLCTNSLALAGFSFTSLAVFLGFYQNNLIPASTIISFLMYATVLFFISSEIAREGHTVGEYLLSEGIYLLASICVFLAFLDFVLANIVLSTSGIMWALLAATILFVFKLVYSGYLVMKRIAAESKRSRKRG